MVLLDAIEDVIDDVVEYAISRWKKLRHNCDFSLWMGYNSDTIERFVSVYRVRRLLQLGQDTRYGLGSLLDFGIPIVDDLTDPIGTHGFDGRMLEQSIASTNERPCSGICKELLLERIGANDGDAGGSRKMAEKFLDFS